MEGNNAIDTTNWFMVGLNGGDKIVILNQNKVTNQISYQDAINLAAYLVALNPSTTAREDFNKTLDAIEA